jgi:hypothetical protein
MPPVIQLLSPPVFQPANAAASVSAVLPFRNGSLCRRCSQVRATQFLRVSETATPAGVRRCGQPSSFAFPKRLRPPVFAGAGNPVPSPFRNGYAPGVRRCGNWFLLAFRNAMPAGIRRCGQSSSIAFPKRLRRRCSQVRAAQFLRLSETATPPDVRQGSALPQTLKKTNGLCPWFGLGPNL